MTITNKKYLFKWIDHLSLIPPTIRQTKKQIDKYEYF